MSASIQLLLKMQKNEGELGQNVALIAYQYLKGPSFNFYDPVMFDIQINNTVV